MTNRFARAPRGFSLVEVLIGIVIGLVVMIIVFQGYANFESVKRTTASGGDAQQNGMISMLRLADALRSSGYGLNDAPILGCPVALYDQAAGAAVPTFPLAPAHIQYDAAGNAVITIVSGSSSIMMSPVQIAPNNQAGGFTGAFKVINRYGFRPGDVILAGSNSVTACTVAQVTSLPVDPSDSVLHVAGNYTDPTGNTKLTTYNSPNGMVYASGAYLYSLGATPTFVRFSVQNQQLVMQSLNSTTAAPVAIADGIMGMRAMYGKDTNADGRVDTWTQTTPTNVGNDTWQNVTAIRFSLLARSQLRERQNATTGNCDATTAATIDSDAAPTGSYTVSGYPDYQCYRYRLYETTIPLRNMIWRFS